MSLGNSTSNSLKIPETVEECDEDAIITIKKQDKISIHRSDGVKHDLVTVFNKAGVAGVVMDAMNNSKSSKNKSNEDKDKHTHTINLHRSDGIGHDINAVLRTTSEKDLTIKKDKPPTSSWQAIKSRVSFLSMGPSKPIVSPVIAPPVTASVTSERRSFAESIPFINNHPSSVRIVHMSDTFNMLKPSNSKNFLPLGDILVHSGNFSIGGTDEEFQMFDNWLKSVKDIYHYRVVCLGHRDVRRFGVEWELYRALLPNATHVLCHEEATILGVKFYVCPWHWGYRFNYAVKPSAPASIASRFMDIPESTHVLVTHGPAYGRLDLTYEGEHFGSRELVDALKKVKPGVHLHGHLTEGRGFIPAFGHLPLTVNSAMCEKSRQVMYACPHVVKCSQIFNESSKAASSWAFAIDFLDG